MGPLAFPVTEVAPASPSPAAAGPFPESLKQREDWGAALPSPQRGGGGGKGKVEGRRVDRELGSPTGLWFPRHLPKEDIYGPEFLL